MADSIKFKRGAKTRLPQLNYGEPAFVSDEKELYIGTESGNLKLTSRSEVEELKNKNNELSSQLEQKALKSDLDIERKRIDSFTSLAQGSTTGDAELIDGRIGANGKKYKNVGESIREQYKDINYFIDKNSTFIDITDILIKGLLNNNGTITESDTDYYTPLLNITNLQNKYIVNCHVSMSACLYLENNNFDSYLANINGIGSRQVKTWQYYARFGISKTNYDWCIANNKRILIKIYDTAQTTIIQDSDEGYYLPRLKNIKVPANLITGEKEVHLGVIKNIVNINQQTISIGEGASKNDEVACIAIGTNSLSQIQKNPSVADDGCFNTAIGHNTMSKATLADHNTAIGWSAMADIISGDGNTAIGEDALLHMVDGNSNVAIGNRAMQNNKTGERNVAIGSASMYYGSNIPSGSKNTAIGYGAGDSNGTGSENVAIGYWAKNGENNFNNCIAIGRNANNTKSNQAVIGNTSIIENIIYGDLIIQQGGVKRKLVFNVDGTITWVTV